MWWYSCHTMSMRTCYDIRVYILESYLKKILYKYHYNLTEKKHFNSSNKYYYYYYYYIHEYRYINDIIINLLSWSKRVPLAILQY